MNLIWTQLNHREPFHRMIFKNWNIKLILVRDFSIDWFEYFFSSSIDKQVAEKKQRRAREWETKIERDRKYVNRHEIVFVFLQQLFFNWFKQNDPNNNILNILDNFDFFFSFLKPIFHKSKHTSLLFSPLLLNYLFVI